MKSPNISSATAGNCRRIRRVEGAPAEPFAARRGAWQSINSRSLVSSDRNEGIVMTIILSIIALLLARSRSWRCFEGANHNVMD